MVQGKIALVTGGAGGIGKATCQVLARDGATVVVADLNIKGAEETVKTLTGKGHTSMLLDVTKETSVNDVFKAIISQYGTPPRIIVNSAGILIFKAFLEETADLYQRQFDINVKGTFFVTQKACKELKAAGLSGSIINLSSVCAVGSPQLISYGGTKAAVKCMSKAIGREMAGFGIRCNAVCPGPISTPLCKEVPEDYKMQYLSRVPIPRYGEPMEVAEMIGLLASEKSSYINASAVKIDGGF